MAFFIMAPKKVKVFKVKVFKVKIIKIFFLDGRLRLP